MRTARRVFIDTLESQIASVYRRPGFVATFEVLSFQNGDAFGPQLEALLTKYKALVDEGASSKVIAADKALQKEWTALIQARFGMKTKLITNSHTAAIIPNFFVEHNPITSDYFRDWAAGNKSIPGVKEIEKMANKSLGTVSLERAKLTGWFSEQECPIYLNMRQLFKDFKMSPAEVTGIALHEIGHGFDAVAFLDRQHTTNRILADVAQYIDTKKEKADVEFVFKEIKKVDPEANRELAEGLVSGNRTVIGVSLYRLAIGTVNSLMTDDTYDRVQFEALSDVFATRFGYGEAVVTGLEKIESKYPEYIQDVFRALMIGRMAIFGTVGLFMSIFVMFTGGAAIGAFYAAINMLCLWIVGKVTGARGKFRIYDDSKSRYLRIRNQIVENIKDPELSDQIKNDLLKQIAVIDGILSGKQTFSFALDNLMDTFNPADRRAKASIESQQKIEAMVANELFVSAARLRS